MRFEGSLLVRREAIGKAQRRACKEPARGGCMAHFRAVMGGIERKQGDATRCFAEKYGFSGSLSDGHYRRPTPKLLIHRP